MLVKLVAFALITLGLLVLLGCAELSELRLAADSFLERARAEAACVESGGELVVEGRELICIAEPFKRDGVSYK